MAKNNNKKSEIEKLDGRSKDVWGERLKKLQQEFPEVLSEKQVDCEQLKNLVGDENIAEGERYQFSWAGKSAAFQEIKKRTTATFFSGKYCPVCQQTNNPGKKQDKSKNTMHYTNLCHSYPPYSSKSLSCASTPSIILN